MQSAHTEKKNAYQVAVLCSGIGGSVIGYKEAGMEVRVAIDYDETSAHVIGKNYYDINVFWQSVKETRGADLRFICREELDILDVAIPSQYINYERKESKKHSKFLLDMVRIVYEAQPKIAVFHFDNRFNQGKHRFLVNEWTELMKQVGYDIHLETLKSSLFGIPNEKKWAFIIGVRNDIGIKPVFPEAPDGNVTTKKVIEDLLSDKADSPITPSRLEYIEKYFYPGISYKEAKRIANELELPIHPALYRRDRWEEPFYPLFGTSTRPVHPVKNRLLTLKEAKRIQTFPDSYKLTDNSTYNWKEVCSSIPPLLMKQVAVAIKKDILDHL